MVKRHTSKESLCCCEYDNIKGERSHLAASLCDCEALDIMFDRCVTCKGVDEDVYANFWATLRDRLRVPWCSGKGAIQVHPDIAVPIIIVPCCILISAIHWYLTVIFLPLLPILMLFHYRMWIKSAQKTRTKLFFWWGLVSTWFLYILFVIYVPRFHVLKTTDVIYCTVLFAWTHYALYHAKKDPGIITKPVEKIPGDSFALNIAAENSEEAASCSDDQKSIFLSEDAQQEEGSYNPTHSAFGETKPEAEPEGDDEQMERYGAVGALLINNFGFSTQPFEKKIKQVEEILEDTIPEDEVDWVDSRPIEDGLLVTWCNYCKMKKPPRAGHCPVCNVCVQVRDHHCVWIDTCIGARNHRAFFLSLVLFVAGTFYGSWCTLNSVCAKRELFTAPLLGYRVIAPFDCEFVYLDYLSALCYVSVLYSSTVALGMTVVLLNQITFISQNLTGQELSRAGPRGWVRHCFFAKNNINNKGVLRNWVSFLRGRRPFQQSYGAVIV